jgi:hypothetical protein
MNTIGAYDDGRGHYNFSFSDNDGKHISVGFRAEPDWDLNVVFQEFRNFLIASGHDVENDIGEIHAYDESDEDDDSGTQSWGDDADEILLDSIRAMEQSQSADKFSMDHLPKNGWPFGGLTTTPLPAMTVTDLSTLTSKSWTEWSAPTMAPLTSRQVDMWSLPTEGIKALTSADIAAWSMPMPMPGTIGGANVTFGDPKNDWSPRSKDYQA